MCHTQFSGRVKLRRNMPARRCMCHMKATLRCGTSRSETGTLPSIITLKYAQTMHCKASGSTCMWSVKKRARFSRHTLSSQGKSLSVPSRR